MSERAQNMPGNAILQSIALALKACYGSLAQPNFSKVYINMKGSAYQRLAENCSLKAFKSMT